MTRLLIDILDEGDKESVLSKLNEFRGKQWIRYKQVQRGWFTRITHDCKRT